MNCRYKYTEQQLRDAIASSSSKHEALIKLGVVAEGGNYRVVNKAIKRYNIDISHMIKKGWSKGKTIGPKRPITDYLSNKYSIQSHPLRKRLISEGYKSHRCENCDLTKWLEKPIPLELDHINGNHEDNSLHNLRLLCPNCHSTTSTYRGKNKKS